MPANTAPIYTRTPDNQHVAIPASTANTARDGTGTTYIAFTADATEGGFVESLRITPKGTIVATNVTIFINNGSDPTVAANNAFFAEVNLSAMTVSQTAANLISTDVSIFRALKAGHRILVAVTTSVASAIDVIAFAGKY